MKCTPLLLVVLLICLYSNSYEQKGGGHAAGGHSGGHTAAHFSGYVGHSSSTPICDISDELQDLRFHDCLIYFTNGDSIQANGIFSAIVKKKDNKNITDMGILLARVDAHTDRFFSFEEIASINIADHDSLLPLKSSVSFTRLDTSQMVWRMIADGKVRVYDQLLYCNEKPGQIGDEFKIVTTDATFMVYRYRGLKSLKGELRDFINNRYNANFVKSDFNSAIDMIKYIAENG